MPSVDREGKGMAGVLAGQGAGASFPGSWRSRRGGWSHGVRRVFRHRSADRDHCRWVAHVGRQDSGVGGYPRETCAWGPNDAERTDRDIGQPDRRRNRQDRLKALFYTHGPGPSSTPSWRGARRWTSVRGGGVRFRRNAEG